MCLFLALHQVVLHSRRFARHKISCVIRHFSGSRGSLLDYVGGWYIKAAKIMENTTTKAAYVSTNSITQGGEPAILWSYIFSHYTAEIIFAYRTFNWDSEANLKAHVHCVIIGFSNYRINQENFFDWIVSSFIIPHQENKKAVLPSVIKKRNTFHLRQNILKKPTAEHRFKDVRQLVLSRSFVHQRRKNDPSLLSCLFHINDPLIFRPSENQRYVFQFFNKPTVY